MQLECEISLCFCKRKRGRHVRHAFTNLKNLASLFSESILFPSSSLSCRGVTCTNCSCTCWQTFCVYSQIFGQMTVHRLPSVWEHLPAQRSGCHPPRSAMVVAIINYMSVFSRNSASVENKLCQRLQLLYVTAWHITRTQDEEQCTFNHFSFFVFSITGV